MKARRPQTGALRFLASPITTAALLTALAAVGVVDRALAVLDRSAATRALLERSAARLAADAAADEYVASAAAQRCLVIDAGSDIVVRTVAEPLRGCGQIRVTATVGQQRLEFAFAPLPGGTAAAFGNAICVPAGVTLPAGWTTPVVVEAADLPHLSDVPQPSAVLARVATADPGIALLRIQAGTDRDDFVLTCDAAPDGHRQLGARGIVGVDGNLWIDQADGPLVLDLDDDLTIVVRGNLYLGRSLRVHGAGTLTLVTVPAPSAVFADKDGNGRWSAGDELRGAVDFKGPQEGVGNVWLGLPRDGHGELTFECGIVAGGVLHVAVDEARVHGALVLQAGGIAVPGRAGRLLATGRHLPELCRAALPGFVPAGGPRPGPVRQVGGEPLYPAAPAR